MSKRGRPTIYDTLARETADENGKYKDFVKMIYDFYLDDPEKTQRRQQNNAYAQFGYWYVLHEIEDQIPYLDEIEKHPTIMEQIGRMFLQDGYGGAGALNVVCLVADWYHRKECTAKEIVSWLKETRKSGKVYTVSCDNNGAETYQEYELERYDLPWKKGLSETDSENERGGQSNDPAI